MWVRGRAASSKGTVWSVTAWFQADSGTNLIKQVWLGSSAGECSHGKRETLDFSPGRPTFFFRPCESVTRLKHLKDREFYFKLHILSNVQIFPNLLQKLLLVF